MNQDGKSKQPPYQDRKSKQTLYERKKLQRRKFKRHLKIYGITYLISK
jgi:hypothetical protein